MNFAERPAQRGRTFGINLLVGFSFEAVLVGVCGLVFVSHLETGHLKTNAGDAFWIGTLLGLSMAAIARLVLRKNARFNQKQSIILVNFSLLPLVILNAVVVFAAFKVQSGTDSAWKLPVLILLVCQWFTLFFWELGIFLKSVSDGAWRD